MPIIRRSFPESFKREAVEQVIAGTPLRHVAQAIGVTEALLGKWKRQYTPIWRRRLPWPRQATR